MPKRRTAILILLVALSGCAALVYEIVWFQLLQLVIGSSAVSLGLLLAAYMGGLCLGSALFARFVPRALHPMRVYGYLELGIGLFGPVALFGIPALGHAYIAGPTSRQRGSGLARLHCCPVPGASDSINGRLVSGNFTMG
jgi:spermidine synthase